MDSQIFLAITKLINITKIIHPRVKSDGVHGECKVMATGNCIIWQSQRPSLGSHKDTKNDVYPTDFYHLGSNCIELK